jgi:DNA-binding NarL/FixJ family response regulator
MLQQLTRREMKILLALADGMTPKRIAEESIVSLHTVRRQIQNILEKLDVHSQLQAVAVARRAGMLAPSGGAELSDGRATTRRNQG